MKTWRRLAFVTYLVMMGPASSKAAPIFRLDDPTPTIVRPESGTVTYEFSGTVTTDPGYRIGMLSRSVLYDSEGNHVSFGGDFFDAVITQTMDGGTYSGPIFSVQVSSDTPLGSYSQTAFGFELPSVTFTGFTIATTDFRSIDISQTYGVNVVPESSSLAIAFAAVAGFWLKRRSSPTK